MTQDTTTMPVMASDTAALVEAMGDAFCDVFSQGNAPTMADMPNPAIYREALTAAYNALRDTLVPVGWEYWPAADTDELPFMQQNRSNMDPRYWLEMPLFTLPELKP